MDEKTIEATTTTHALVDPGAGNVTVHEERLRALVNNVALTTLNEFRGLGEAIQTMIRTMSDRQEKVIATISEFSEDAQSGLDASKVMREAITELNDRLKIRPPTSAPLTGAPGRANGSSLPPASTL